MLSSISIAFPSLTVAEGRALLRAHIHGLAPTSDADDRRLVSSSASPPLKLAHKLLNENVMRRTLHLIPAATPDTHDERIRNTFRRKSYPTYITQFEDDHAAEPLW
ncbi:hypothetical protein C8R44DRAFT_888801 [Mycena epipterygia]|nr:hypothetical protein C8R44DRAFT_888801 [Mycena epipterygia]